MSKTTQKESEAGYLDYKKRRSSGGQQMRRENILAVMKWVKASKDANNGIFDDRQEAEVRKMCMQVLGVTLQKTREYINIALGRESDFKEGD